MDGLSFGMPYIDMDTVYEHYMLRLSQKASFRKRLEAKKRFRDWLGERKRRGSPTPVEI